MHSCTTVTKEAITTIKDGIRTFAGITLRRDDTTIFEQTRTKVVASPIPRPFSALVVTARAGQRPSSSRNTALFCHKALSNSRPRVMACLPGFRRGPHHDDHDRTPTPCAQPRLQLGAI